MSRQAVLGARLRDRLPRHHTMPEYALAAPSSARMRTRSTTVWSGRLRSFVNQQETLERGTHVAGTQRAWSTLLQGAPP